MNPSAFRDLGRVANASEPRTCVLNKGTDGDFYFVVCAYEFVTCTNLRTKESGYYPYPDGYKAFPFGSLGTKSGKIYIGAGRYFYEFDPVTKQYTFAAMPHPDEFMGMDCWNFVEDKNGLIYFGTNPKTYLTSFDPQTRTFTDYGVMDPEEAYLESVAVDNVGWIYCGIATSKCEIMAIHSVTREKRVIEVLPQAGWSVVCQGTDGHAYGSLLGTRSGRQLLPEEGWYRLENGEKGEAITEPVDTFYERVGFHTIHCPYEEHPVILHQELVDHELRYLHPETGEETEIYLPYETMGAISAALSAGPDGKVYGSTYHPFQFFRYDPAQDLLTNFGQKQTISLGNICAYATQGNILAGIAYCGGHVMRIDTTKPMCEAYDENPHCEASFQELLRPRSACALPDGKTIVFGGYNDNGVTGGGVVVYDTIARTCRSILNEKMLTLHSVLAMAPISETQIWCGSCVEAPCGGHAQATEAVLFLYDLAAEQVLDTLVPVPGARTIMHMKTGTDGLIHGITANSVHFAFDPIKRTVVYTEDLSAYGEVPRQSMQTAEDGTIWGVLGHAIYRIKPNACAAEIVSALPDGMGVGMGIAVIGTKLYFSSSSHVWEYTIA